MCLTFTQRRSLQRWSMVKPSGTCPLTMTHAAVPVLRQEPALAEWADKAAAPFYDARDLPIGDKPGITVGMVLNRSQEFAVIAVFADRCYPADSWCGDKPGP